MVIDLTPGGPLLLHSQNNDNFPDENWSVCSGDTRLFFTTSCTFPQYFMSGAIVYWEARRRGPNQYARIMLFHAWLVRGNLHADARRRRRKELRGSSHGDKEVRGRGGTSEGEGTGW